MNTKDAHVQDDKHKDLRGRNAIEKIQEIVDEAKSCFFCTRAQGSEEISARPMAAQKADDNGSIWFLSGVNSQKNEELAQDPHVTLYFQSSAHSGFLELRGRVKVTKDKERIDELWSFVDKTWFTEGKDDPRISVIQFIPDEGHYWDTKNGGMLAGIKMLLGAVAGKRMDDGVEGSITV